MRGRTIGDPSTPRHERHDYWGVVLDAPDGVVYLACQTAEGYVAPTWPNAEGQQQMMTHLDFEVSDLAAAVAHACELGARPADHQPQTDVRVLLDPAGHPFCLYRDES